MIKFIKLDDIIKDIDIIYAHKDGDRIETLREHLDNCKKLIEYFDSIYKIEEKIRMALSNLEIKKKGKAVYLSENEINFIVDMFFNIIYLHDIGKINPKFQVVKMNNLDFNNVDKITSMDSPHSPLSTIIFINEYLHRLKEEDLKEKLFLKAMILYFANIIYCHHGSLENLENTFTKDKLEEMLNVYKLNGYLDEYKRDLICDKKIAGTLDKIKSLKIEFNSKVIYVITKISHSLLTSCDFIATNSFKNDINVSDFKLALIEDINPVIESFKNTDVYKGMMNYKEDKNYFLNSGLPPINMLRSDIAIECSNTIDIYKRDYFIFNIEAPTGSGKTYNSLGCVLKLLELEEHKKIIYISPINCISSQTKEEYIKIFDKILDMQEINSITPIPERLNLEGVLDYDKTLLHRQLLNYNITFTSHVSLFDILFGTSRENSMPLFQLFNSVIILDEIQNYKNLIWKETIEMLDIFSKIMNIKIIIMSATLPNLHKLIRDSSSNFIDLLKAPENYYKNPLFKDRVTIDGTMLKKKVTFDDLKYVMVKEINDRYKLHNERGQIFLAEFIKKKTAIDFYNKIKDELSVDEYEIYELDGNNSLYSKNELIEKIKGYKGDKHLILVTTQVIEAGVDIDADLGMKDAVFPDVDEQFMGRINRSGKKKDCKVFFFNYDDEKDIYREDLRLGSNIKNDIFFNALKEKQFKNVLYEMVIDKIEQLKNMSITSSIKEFDSELFHCKYKDISKRMKLIDNETFNIYIPTKSIPIKDKDGNIVYINGFDVWDEYLRLLNDDTLSYSERRVKLSNLRENMSLFTYTIYGKGLSGLDPIGGLYYIEEGESYLKEGKLNLEIFLEKFNIIK